MWQASSWRIVVNSPELGSRGIQITRICYFNRRAGNVGMFFLSLGRGWGHISLFESQAANPDHKLSDVLLQIKENPGLVVFFPHGEPGDARNDDRVPWKCHRVRSVHFLSHLTLQTNLEPFQDPRLTVTLRINYLFFINGVSKSKTTRVWYGSAEGGRPLSTFIVMEGRAPSENVKRAKPITQVGFSPVNWHAQIEGKVKESHLMRTWSSSETVQVALLPSQLRWGTTGSKPLALSPESRAKASYQLLSSKMWRRQGLTLIKWKLSIH